MRVNNVGCTARGVQRGVHSVGCATVRNCLQGACVRAWACQTWILPPFGSAGARNCRNTHQRQQPHTAGRRGHPPPPPSLSRSVGTPAQVCGHPFKFGFWSRTDLPRRRRTPGLICPGARRRVRRTSRRPLSPFTRASPLRLGSWCFDFPALLDTRSDGFTLKRFKFTDKGIQERAKLVLDMNLSMDDERRVECRGP